MSKPRPIRWSRRTAVWLFGVVALTFVLASGASYFVGSAITTAVLDGMHYAPGALCEEGPEPYVQYTGSLASAVAEGLPDDAPIDQESIAGVLGDNCYQGQFPIVVDNDGKVLFRPEGIEEFPARWPMPLEQCAQVHVFGTEDEIWRAFHSPLHRPGYHLVLIDVAAWSPLEGPSFGEMLPVPRDVATVFDPRSTLSERTHSAGKLAEIAGFLVAGLTVLIASLLLARLVVRPLVRLSDQATQSVSPENALARPFEAPGLGEVESLTACLNDLRGRVNGLVTDLQSADRRRRAWVAQISHDLRTPMTALRACLDRLESQVSREPVLMHKKSLRDTISTAQLDLDRLLEMAHDLFEIARLEHSGDLALEEVLPAELVRRTVRAIEPIARERAVELEVDLDPAAPALAADGNRLTRALENLLRNAIQHARNKVAVAVERHGDRLLFRVTDDGSGFPQARGLIDLDKAGSVTRPDGSAGLGLMVVQRVARAHGGEAGGQSEPERGSAMWISLPLKAGATT